MTAVRFPDFEDLLIGVPTDDIRASFELVTVKPVCQLVYTLPDGFNLEVGPLGLFVKIVVGLPNFLGVITPVPALETAVNAVGIHHFLACRSFPFRYA